MREENADSKSTSDSTSRTIISPDVIDSDIELEDDEDNHMDFSLVQLS